MFPPKVVFIIRLAKLTSRLGLLVVTLVVDYVVDVQILVVIEVCFIDISFRVS